jgi:hypothetical protein
MEKSKARPNIQTKGRRGGARPGAGRPSKKVDWDTVARAYFTGAMSVEDACKSFGLSYGDLLAYATSHHWCRPSSRPHPDDLGDLASALARHMFSIDGATKRLRCFVSAMVHLEARVADIAEVMSISESALRAEFSKELAGAR